MNAETLEEVQGFFIPAAIAEWGSTVLWALGVAILIIVIARVILRFLYLVVDRGLKPRTAKPDLWEERKFETLRALSRSVLQYVIYFIAAVTILDTLGVGVASVIAGAGVLGLAIGFGAQNLVRDIITGFFIIFEDQYAVGEYISAVGVSGIVQELGLRVTKINDFSGDLHIIPNGNIVEVTNHNRSPMRAMVDISVAYEEDVDRVLEVMKRVSDQLGEEIDAITDGPTVLGVANLGDSDVVIRVLARTQPMEQWAVEREMLRRFKKAFDEEGIEIPYPRRVVIRAGEDQKHPGA